MKNKLILTDLLFQFTCIFLLVIFYLYDPGYGIKSFLIAFFFLFSSNVVLRIIFLKSHKKQTKLISIATWMSLMVLILAVIFFGVLFIVANTDFLSGYISNHTDILGFFLLLMVFSIILIIVSLILFLIELVKSSDGSA